MIANYKNRFLEAINDDMNMPVAVSIVWEAAKNDVKSNDIFELIMHFDEVLSLKLDTVKNNDNKSLEIPQEIQELLEKRKAAREQKDYAMSDKIRDELKEKGYIVKDSKEGQKIEKV